MGLFSTKNLGKAVGGVTFGLPGLFFGNEYDKMTAADKARAGFDPYSGMPSDPQYIGMEPAAINAAYANDPLDRSALGKYTNEAMRTGPSRNAMIAMQANRADTALNASKARKLAAGTTAEARSQLAMKGGLGAGGAERLAASGRDKAADLVQMANQQGAQGRVQIGMEDERNRVNMLGQAPGMNLAAAQYGTARAEGQLDRLTNESTKRNAFNLGQYQNKMNAWAGGKQAEATMKSGKKG